MSKAKDNRKLIQFRAQPDTVRRIEQWYEADGCQSRNEFMERAVTYYADALALMDSSLLPDGCPPTKRQERLVRDLVRNFPDVESLAAYKDYASDRTRANASALISAALETH